MSESPSFVFVTCQVGAEAALKREMAHEWPALRFAFSRPGFLTFKAPPATRLPPDWSGKLVFARAAGICLGKLAGNTPEQRAGEVWTMLAGLPVDQLHVWPRDQHAPGYRDYDPGMTAEAKEVEQIVLARRPGPNRSDQEGPFRQGPGPDSDPSPAPPLRKGTEASVAADVVIVTADEWWVGFHHVTSLASSWAGGFLPAEKPEAAVSRAWLKMQEAILWAGFHMRPGEKCIEIGSAPGGASQYLLSQGLHVTGIDPAEMAPEVLADKRFRHLRMRSKEVPRKEFVGVDWLTCDVNLPPNYTLDTVRAIVTHSNVLFKGMLLTFKLVEWSLARELPKYLERIRSWGFRRVEARQLHHNRQEVCVAASGYRAAGKAVKGKKKNARPVATREKGE